MTFLFTLQTIFEIALVIAVFWGIFHEDKLIAFEKRVICSFKRRRLNVINSVSFDRSNSPTY